MQIGTNLFYDSSAKRMTALSDRATVLQTQISTGKKIQTPSGDAVISQATAEFNRQDADAAVYGTNLTLAGSQLQQTDSTLEQISSQVQRALELATQAATGTQSAASRAIIGNELQSIAGALVGLANTSDVRGQPLFGTPDGTAAVVANGSGGYDYAKTNVSDVPIAKGQSVQASESASRVFTFGDGKDTLGTITRLAQALVSGTASSDDLTGALGDLNGAVDQVSTVRASVGARAARVELQQTLMIKSNTDRAALRESVEDTDVTTAIADLQKTMTVLSATQASFTKLASLSLFDYLK
jgi:flagellar hook-associated protein 3 FlgL